MAQQLSLRQKVGQLMVIGFPSTTPSEAVLRFIREDFVGGIILFGRNVGTPEELLRLNAELQQAAYEAGQPDPLLICIDQENGVVRRLGAGTTYFPGQMLQGAADSQELTRSICEASAIELKSLGVNMNLAPDVDVNNNPKNPVIGVRSFGEDADRVSELGTAAIAGYQSGGVMTCAKHFPGHGDTELDSHLTLPCISHDRNRLEEIEFKPFRAAIAAGVDAVMIAHVCFPSIEPEPDMPATISKRVVTGLLREELGYQGVITTDCLEMNAISETIGVAEGALAALKAGIDLLMVSHRPEWQREAIDRIVKAVEMGEILEERIDESMQRIRSMKQKYMDWYRLQGLLGNQQQVPSAVGSAAHTQLAQAAAERGVSIVKAGQLPFKPQAGERILVVFPQNKNRLMVEDIRYLHDPLAAAVKAFYPDAVTVETANPPIEQDLQEALAKAESADYLILGTLDAARNEGQAKLVKRLAATGKPLAVVAMRGPYDLLAFPEVANFVAAYEFTPICVETAVAAVFGAKSPSGRLPVSLPGLFERGWREGDTP